jgi:hypothetical protein
VRRDEAPGSARRRDCGRARARRRRWRRAETRLRERRPNVDLDGAALGHKFVFHSTIANTSGTPLRGLIAHLNVLSLHSGVYVDPEDWSSDRTRYLAPIPARGSVTLTWRMQAVNSGSFRVYVAVLPRSGAARPPVTGPTIRVAIAHRRTINSGGILPLALGIPGFLGGLWLAVRARRRAASPTGSRVVGGTSKAPPTERL